MRYAVMCALMVAAMMGAVMAVGSGTIGWGAEAPSGNPVDCAAPILDPLDRELLEDLEGRSGLEEPGVPGQPGQSEQPGEAQPPDREPAGPGKRVPGKQYPGERVPREHAPGEHAPGQHVPAGPPPGQPGEQEGLDERLGRELGRAAVSEQQEPLLEIARQMRVVEQRIGEYDSGSATQSMQQQIVADLEHLIAEARKACKQGGPAAGQSQQVASRTPLSQPNPQQPGAQQPGQRPGTTSTPRQGQSEPGAVGPDAAQLRELVKDLWGELPPRAREQMLETFDEAFVPKYRLLIEQYFRRLAEGRRSDGFGP